MYYGTNGLGSSYQASAQYQASLPDFGSGRAGTTSAPTTSTTSTTSTRPERPVYTAPVLEPSYLASMQTTAPRSMVEGAMAAQAAYAESMRAKYGTTPTAPQSMVEGARAVQASYAEHMRELGEKKNQLIDCGVPPEQAQAIFSQGSAALDQALIEYCSKDDTSGGSSKTMLLVAGVLGVVVVGGVLYAISR